MNRKRWMRCAVGTPLVVLGLLTQDVALLTSRGMESVLKAEGYRFVTVAELLALGGVAPAADSRTSALR